MPYDVGSIVGRIRMDTTQWDQTRLRIVSNVRGLAASFVVAGAAMATPLVAAVKEFGKFELAMRRATSVSKTTEVQFAEMSKQAEAVSVKWGIAADETAKAFLFLGRAGLTASQQMQAFEPVIMASKAMMEDLEKTTEGVVNVMNSFGISFEHTGYIADVMTQAVNASTMNLQELMIALSYAGKPAKAFNNNIEDTAAMIGLVANEGIRGSKAGTALRFALTALASPTAEARNLLHELGIQAYDASTRQMVPFIDIISQLENKLEGTSEQLRNVTLETLFGRRALPAMIALFEKGSVGVRKFSDSLRTANGVTKETAEKQMKALWSRVQQVWQAFLMLTRHIIVSVAPAITNLAERIRNFLTILTDMVDKNQDLAKQWVLQIAHVARLALEWGAFLTVASVLAGTLNKILNLGASVVNGVLIPMAKAVEKVAAGYAIMSLNLVLIAASAYLVSIMWRKFKDDTEEKTGNTISNVQLMKDSIVNIMESLAGFIETIASRIWSALTNMIPDSIKDKLQDLADWAKAYVKGMQDVKNWGVLGKVAAPVAGFVWKGLKSGTLNEGYYPSYEKGSADEAYTKFKLSKNYETYQKVVKSVTKNSGKTLSYYAKGDLRGIIEGARNEVLPLLKDFLEGARKYGEDFAKSLIPPEIMKAWEDAVVKAKEVEKAIISTQIVKPNIVEIVGKWQYIATMFQQAWLESIGRTQESFKTAQEVMSDGMKDMVEGWTDAFDQLMQTGSSFVDFMDNLFQSVLKSFEHMISQMLAQNMFDSIFGKGTGERTLPSAGGWLGDIVGAMFGNKTYAVPALPDMPVDIGGSMPNVGGFSGNFGASPKVVLQVSNNGAPVALKQVGQQQVGKDMVVSYVMDEIEHNPRFRDVVRGRR